MKSFILSGLAAIAYAQGTPDLTAALSGNPNLSQLAQLIGAQPQLGQALASASNITVLAPSNAALSALLNSTSGAALASNPAAVAALLQYHVLNGTYPASAVTNSSAFIPTLLTGTSPYANVTSGQRVEARLANGNVTFFTGLGNNSTVSQANVNFTGGVIHVINRVLTLPSTASNTLVEGGLTTLYGALNRTNLLNTVDGLSDVTIFAPANAAFRAIGSALGNITNDALSSVLQYHVIQGGVPLYSTSLSNNAKATTLGKGDITVRIQGKNVFVNNAKVIIPNVLIGGGVVHVIDQVLNPQNATAAPGDNAANGVVAFQGATSVSSDLLTSGVPTATGKGLGGAATSATGTATSKANAQPMQTNAVGVAALFGAGVAILNM